MAVQELDKCGQARPVFVTMFTNKRPDAVLDRVESGVHAPARWRARRRGNVRGLKHHTLAREFAEVRGWLGVVTVRWNLYPHVLDQQQQDVWPTLGRSRWP